MTIEKLYENYLKELSVNERLQLIKLLINSTFPSVLKNESRGNTYSIMDFEGVGKSKAMNEDAQDYINKLRSEWD